MNTKFIKRSSSLRWRGSQVWYYSSSDVSRCAACLDSWTSSTWRYNIFIYLQTHWGMIEVNMAIRLSLAWAMSCSSWYFWLTSNSWPWYKSSYVSLRLIWNNSMPHIPYQSRGIIKLQRIPRKVNIGYKVIDNVYLQIRHADLTSNSNTCVPCQTKSHGPFENHLQLRFFVSIAMYLNRMAS